MGTEPATKKKCSHCGDDASAEALGDGRVRVSCAACGHIEVLDAAGRRLLLDEGGGASAASEAAAKPPRLLD